MNITTVSSVPYIACLLCTLVPSLLQAQSDTVSISGTFQMLNANGVLSPDLASVFARRQDHTWTLTMSGVSYEYDYTYDEYGDPQTGIGYYESYITRVHPTSCTLEFFGPDAAILNSVVSSQLTRGGGVNGAAVTLSNDVTQDPQFPEYDGAYFSCSISLLPDTSNGVSFSSYAYDWQPVQNYVPGHPDLTPRRLWIDHELIDDFRSPYSGSINSYGQLMDIGSSVPPTIAPGISILDGSVAEGNKGTTALNLVVTLSASSSQQITAQYRTVNGTAIAKSDYTSTSGTVTFRPGETRKTITVSIVADRKREPNETFTVELSNPSGASFFDSVATATILNDD